MLTKKQQTKQHSRLKPEPYKEPKYLKWLHEVEQPTCFVCGISIGIQMHHIKAKSSDVKKDNEVIPLCYNHHLGNDFSTHGTPKAFREIYPIEVQREYAKKLYSKYKKGL